MEIHNKITIITSYWSNEDQILVPEELEIINTKHLSDEYLLNYIPIMLNRAGYLEAENIIFDD